MSEVDDDSFRCEDSLEHEETIDARTFAEVIFLEYGACKVRS